MLNPEKRLLKGEEGRKIFDIAKQPNIEVVFDPDEFEAKGLSEEEINDLWVEMRKGYYDEDGIKHCTVGGSDEAQIQGVSPFGTALDLFNVKTGRKESSMDLDDPDNWYRLQFGHTNEELVCLAYLVQHPKDKIIIDKRTFKRTDKPYLIFDVDGIIIYGDGSVGVFECKSTTYHNKDVWQENVPSYYKLQLMHYMGGLSLERSTIACLWGNNLSTDYAKFDVDADEDLIEELFDDAAAFADDTDNDIEPKIKVSAEHADVALESLRKSFDTSDVTITASYKTCDSESEEQAVLAIEELRKLEKEKDELKKKEKEIECRVNAASIPIISYLKEKDGNKIEYYDSSNKNSARITFTGSSRRKVNIERLKREFPDVASSIIKESVSLSDLNKCGVSKAKSCCDVVKGLPTLKAKFWDY